MGSQKNPVWDHVIPKGKMREQFECRDYTKYLEKTLRIFFCPAKFEGWGCDQTDFEKCMPCITRAWAADSHLVFVRASRKTGLVAVSHPQLIAEDK